MIEKIKALLVKYREIIVYVIVGGLTTVFSWGCKFLWVVWASPLTARIAWMPRAPLGIPICEPERVTRSIAVRSFLALKMRCRREQAA